MDESEFTPIQRRLLKVLSDGISHSKEELLQCLNDIDSPSTNVTVQVCLLNRKLRPKGHEIVCEYKNRRGFYRHVLTLPPQSAE